MIEIILATAFAGGLIGWHEFRRRTHRNRIIRRLMEAGR